MRNMSNIFLTRKSRNGFVPFGFLRFLAIFFFFFGSLSSYCWPLVFFTILSLSNVWSGPGSMLLRLTNTNIVLRSLSARNIQWSYAFDMRWPHNERTFEQLRQNKLFWSHIPPLILTCCFAHKFKKTFISFFSILFTFWAYRVVSVATMHQAIKRYMRPPQSLCTYFESSVFRSFFLYILFSCTSHSPKWWNNKMTIKCDKEMCHYFELNKTQFSS